MTCNLTGILFVSYPYTWSKSKGTPHVVEERLDKAMATNDWLYLSPNVELKNVMAFMSDHIPILLCTNALSYNYRRRKFKFENVWLLEGSCQRQCQQDIVSKICGCQEELEDWGRRVRSWFRDDIKRSKHKLENLRYEEDDEIIKEFNKKKENFTKLLLQEWSC